jgi:hypothetical protein
MPIKWQDVIDIYDKPVGLYTPVGTLSAYIDRTKKFLDQFEETPEGQRMLQSIGEIYGAKKLKLSVSDFGENVVYGYGHRPLTLNITPLKWIAFIDQDISQPRRFSFESIIFHELYHASDKKFLSLSKLGIYPPELKPLIEDLAVKATDDYARKYASEWGIRGSHRNAAGTPPVTIVSTESREQKNAPGWNPGQQDRKDSLSEKRMPGIDGIKMLTENPKLREEIEESVRTVDERIKQAQQEWDKKSAAFLVEENTVFGDFTRAAAGMIAASNGEISKAPSGQNLQSVIKPV